ncbi:MAG: YbaK/EbsC family protein [Halobacteriota archaeon]|uniref:YbaK/EbsC family protein n=1 Tax=Natronomonas sp. TaxID=2184060 RepID=UPI0039771CFA
MHPRAEEFKRTAKAEYGFDVDVKEFPEGTKTAADAAEAVGCSVEQIASGIVLSTGDGLVVSITSGANRVSMAKIASLVDADESDVSMAEADAIKGALGWSIGGVPPFCHDTDVPVYMDETLAEFETVWAAAGTPTAVFPIDPRTLSELAGAPLTDVRE